MSNVTFTVDHVVDGGISTKVEVQVRDDGTIGAVLIPLTEQQVETVGYTNVMRAALEAALTLPHTSLAPLYSGDIYSLPSPGGDEHEAFLVRPHDITKISHTPRVLAHCEGDGDTMVARITERFKNQLRPVAVTVVTMDEQGGVLSVLTD